MNGSVPVTVLLVDDHPMFREGLRFALSTEADLTVAGEACDGNEAVLMSRELAPDVVVMDLAMPHRGGLDAIRELRAGGSLPRILVLTMSDDDASIAAAVQAGANGYLVKGAAPEHFLSAVRAVHSGHAVFGPDLAGRMLQFFTSAAAPSVGVPGLSVREQEVLALLADGLSNQAIGRALFISPITVRNHVSSILAKLQVTNRREAMLLMHHRGRADP